MTLHDPLQVLVALACDLELDTLPCCAETHKWAWFRRYCMASRVAVALDRRTPLPRLFLDEVRAGVESPASGEHSAVSHQSVRLLALQVPQGGPSWEPGTVLTLSDAQTGALVSC